MSGIESKKKCDKKEKKIMWRPSHPDFEFKDRGFVFWVYRNFGIVDVIDRYVIEVEFTFFDYFANSESEVAKVDYLGFHLVSPFILMVALEINICCLIPVWSDLASGFHICVTIECFDGWYGLACRNLFSYLRYQISILMHFVIFIEFI